MIIATLHFEHGEIHDTMRVSADTIEDLRIIANREVERRGPDNYWSSDVEVIRDE